MGTVVPFSALSVTILSKDVIVCDIAKRFVSVRLGLFFCLTLLASFPRALANERLVGYISLLSLSPDGLIV